MSSLGTQLNQVSELAKQTAITTVREYATNTYIPFLQQKMFEAARAGKKSLQVFVDNDIVSHQPPEYFTNKINSLLSAFPETERVIVDTVRNHYESPTLLVGWHHRGEPGVPYHELGLKFNWDPDMLSRVVRSNIVSSICKT